MKRFLAVLIGFLIICLLPAALANDLDDDFAEAFDSYRVDPFSDFDPAFEDDPFPMDDGEDPFAGFTDDTDPFAAYTGDDSTTPYGNAFMSYDSSSAEDNEDPFADPFADPDATPAPDAPSAAGSMNINIAGEALVLNFDASPAYSSVQSHLVQASFYTYGSATGNLYELFLTFPDSVRAGDAITPEYAMKSAVDSSVVLLVSSPEKDTFYVASQQTTSGPYPETSSYSLRFDSVASAGGTTTYTGTLDANLVSLSQKTGEVDKSLRIEGANFTFTIAGDMGGKSDKGDGNDDNADNSGSSGGSSPDPFDEFTDLPTLKPQPTPTLAPDFRRV